MTNATISKPVSKLYRMCGVYNQHAACKGKFENHSVCSCDCHKPAKAKKPARVYSKPVVAVKPARVEKPLDQRVVELAAYLCKVREYIDANYTDEQIAQAHALATVAR